MRCPVSTQRAVRHTLCTCGETCMTLLANVGRLFPRNQAVEAVATKVHFDASSEAVWRGLLFYEEVPHRPMPVLRMFLPVPIRTEGEKTRVGARIKCTYDGGYLEKRITEVEPGQRIKFDVLVQDLGIEDCISMHDGSYEIRAERGGFQVVLTTGYRGHLRPRWLWRPLEHFLAHRLHNHILGGMRLKLEETFLAPQPAALSSRGDA
jgi:hypothetical protein